ncbi:hypothetical protein VIGAN_06195700 [Vigna angularis var. angularis]|uniref:Pentacotripeptide-repeat region of PRORP domain-containing protein n=1 Tax=Vigna angularis var. angularis TaxID=157739 RepID=A0A0S3SCT2_PHAAN|nr:hypothetical protein VIGAN_06195700 [Vigna angularis var. angularis]
MERDSVGVDEHSLPEIVDMYVCEGYIHKVYQLLKKFHINREMSLKIWAAVMDVFAERGLCEETENLFYGGRDLTELGFKPPCQTFYAVIGYYARLGQLSDAKRVYVEMVRVGVRPNEVVYGSLLNGYVEHGSLEEALKYFYVMEESGFSANLAKLAFENLREMGRVDAGSYATIMYLYKAVGMMDKAIEIAEEMKLSGLLKDCVSYNKVLVCYATNGQFNECGKLIHEMISMKLFPNDGTFKVLFTILKKGGIPNEAVAQLESSYREGKPYARQATFTALYSLVGMHTLALEYARTFIESEVELDSSTYNVAIYAYGSVGDINKVLNIYMKMRDKRVGPDLATYIYLVGCYGKAGMVEGVKRVYSQLEYGEIELSESLYKAFIEAYKICNRKDLAELVRQEMRFALNSEEHSEVGSEGQYDVGSEDEYEVGSEDEYIV